MAFKGACNEIKFQHILDQPALPAWVKGNVAHADCAAHPFFPCKFWTCQKWLKYFNDSTVDQGQGGTQGIEDGVVLAAVLPLGTKMS